MFKKIKQANEDYIKRYQYLTIEVCKLLPVTYIECDSLIKETLYESKNGIKDITIKDILKKYNDMK